MARKKSAARKKKRKAHHRAAASNPPKKRRHKRRKMHHRRAVAANPRPRKRRKMHHRRVARANPPKARHKRRKRHHRRNPDVPMWAMAAIGAVLGLVSFTAVSAGTFALTQRLDPTLATLIRNRRIAAGLFTVGGVALAMVSPILGAGVAAGGLAVLAGTEASLALGNLIDVKPAASATPATPAAGATQAVAQQTTKGIFGGGRQQLPNMSGVFQRGRQQLPHMSGVFGTGGHQTFSGVEDGYGATAF